MKKLLSLILAFILIFSALSLIGYATTDDTIDYFALSSVIDTDENPITVEWFKGEEGFYYFFMPTSISTALCKVSFVADGDVYIDGVKISNNSTISFAGKDQVTVTCEGKDYTAKIIAETKIASVFITTESGSLDDIYADKDHKESGYIQIVDADGITRQYDGDLDYIKGRGNSTWKMDKKPYNIKLDKKADLFGMGKSKKWSLIANHGDTSLIRNAVIYQASGYLLEYTPKFVPVDLYINNDYMGSFLLTTRIEVDDNRVEIDNLDDANEDANPDVDFDTLRRGGVYGTYSGLIEDSKKWVEIPNDPENITGGYLMEFEIADRYDSEISGFVSHSGQPIIFKTPEYATEKEINYISSVYQSFEDAVMSEDGYNSDGKHYTSLCDIESFQKFYAINEWASNMDFGLTSTYLYKPADDDLIYAGPVWDFDIALGNNSNTRYGCNYKNPYEFTVCFGRQYKNTVFGKADVSKVPTLFNTLCQKEEFTAGVKNVWDNEIKRAVDNVNGTFIPQYYNDIEGSAVANAIRWNIYDTSDIDTIKASFKNDVDYVRNFSVERAEFLSENFGTVQVQQIEETVYDKILSAVGTAINNAFEWFIVATGMVNDN